MGQIPKGSALGCISKLGIEQEIRKLSSGSERDFAIEKGQLIGLLGPSGGGKTSILRMLAGLESVDEGDIVFHGKRVNDFLRKNAASASFSRTTRCSSI